MSNLTVGEVDYVSYDETDFDKDALGLIKNILKDRMTEERFNSIDGFDLKVRINIKKEKDAFRHNKQRNKN